MNACFDDTALIQQLQSLEAQLLVAIRSGVDACSSFSSYLGNTLTHAQQAVNTGRASPRLAQVLSAVAQPLDSICATFEHLLQEKTRVAQRQEDALQTIYATVARRRRKRSTRSRKSKAGKNGQVRQSGKKSKRGRKSPVGNPKRRVQLEVDPNTSKANATDGSGRKCRTVTAPPTDSMKFGPCRDFFLNHLGDPYPTTVQKHQILKQSSPDFSLRSLNLWFVNIRRRSGWMNIFKKHAASKREAMRDLVARVEAQVAGRPAPNPLPSGATPPGFKVEQEIVDEIMAMRAVVDMVSREVYGEGWDQILQIKPWTEEEVRAHEERKKAARREARAAKADGDKKRKERDEHREQRKKDKESRKRVELEAVEGIRAARELHVQLMSSNKRKRGDEDGDHNNNTAKRTKNGKEAQLDENGQPKKRKIKVPKVDENGNPLTKEQRKALKKAMLAAQAQAAANPLKRKTPDADPAFPGASDTMDISPKRRRRDAVTFDGFPAPGEPMEETGMPDLSQLFSMEWASPPASTVALPTSETPPPESSEFARPSGNLAAPAPIQTDVHAPVAGGERRFSQQLAAYALESGMFDNEGFGLFNADDTFPGMAVDVNADALMTSAGHASASPAQTESHTPIPTFTTPIQPPQEYGSFAPADVGSHSPATPYSAARTITPGGNTDSEDMSWINAAIAQLPSEHDVQRQQHHEQYHHHYGSQGGMYASGSSAPYHSPATVFAPTPEQRAPVSHQRTQGHPQSQNAMPPPPPPTTSPNQSRPSFPRPQARTSVPPPSFPQPQPPPQQRQRAPGTLWQTPYSHPTQQQQPQQPYQPAYSPQPTPRQPHSFPAPAQPQPSYDEQMYDHRTYSQPTPPTQHEHEYQTYTHPDPAPAQHPGMVLKQRELEFARAQEELQQRFKREQEEQLARFMRSQEDLRKQFLGSPAV